MLNDSDKLIGDHFKSTGISVDELGRVQISDETLLNFISGSAGDNICPGGQPLWNGACSNAHCSLTP